MGEKKSGLHNGARTDLVAPVRDRCAPPSIPPGGGGNASPPVPSETQPALYITYAKPSLLSTALPLDSAGVARSRPTL